MNLSIALVVASLFAPSIAAQQEEPPKDPNFKAPQVTTRTQIERLFRAYGITHGSRQALKDLKTLSFKVLPTEITEEGKTSMEPINVDAQMNGIDRIMRLEEEVDGRSIVKFADGMTEVAAWVNGEKREIPELLQGAQMESLLFYVFLDLLYKPESADLKAKMGPDRKRKGVDFHTVEYEFHTSRGIPHTYRLFYEKETGLVNRIDVHDTRTSGNLRVYSMLLSEYSVTEAAKKEGEAEIAKAVERATKRLAEASTDDQKKRAEQELEQAKFPPRTPRFPGRVELVNREGQAFVIWTLVDYVANAEFELGHFSEP